MKRVVLLSAMALSSVGCFGACGSGDGPSASGGASSSSSETTTTAGSDTTGSDTTGSDESESATLVDSTDPCTSDADCVPAGCCHPAACVSREHAPACGQSVCTTECRYGTLDCGGGCLCHEGHCAAHLSPRPNIPGVTDVQ